MKCHILSRNQESLIPVELSNILSCVVKVVNFVQHHALNSRLFETLCADMGSEYKRLLMHTEVRWLSRGKVLNRLFHLRDEVVVFLEKQGSRMAENGRDPRFLAYLAYLSDIFDKFKELNLWLQGSSLPV